MAAVKILVVDDDPNTLANIVDFLEFEDDFTVATATNGNDGILQATAFKPDLILCDRIMKDGNGNDMLKAIRTNRSTAQIPFVFLTAMVMRDAMREGMVLGADDYLTKPFTRAELLSTIWAQIEKARARAADTKAKIAVISEAIRTHLNHIYGNLELYRADNPSVLENEEFADAWNSCLLAIAKIEKIITALASKQ